MRHSLFVAATGSLTLTMQEIADELIRLEGVDYITDTTVCEVMKKTKKTSGTTMPKAGSQ